MLRGIEFGFDFDLDESNIPTGYHNCALTTGHLPRRIPSIFRPRGSMAIGEGKGEGGSGEDERGDGRGM